MLLLQTGVLKIYRQNVNASMAFEQVLPETNDSTKTVRACLQEATPSQIAALQLQGVDVLGSQPMVCFVIGGNDENPSQYWKPQPATDKIKYQDITGLHGNSTGVYELRQVSTTRPDMFGLSNILLFAVKNGESFTGF